MSPRHVKRGLIGVDDHRLFCDVAENNIMKICLIYLILFCGRVNSFCGKYFFIINYSHIDESLESLQMAALLNITFYSIPQYRFFYYVAKFVLVKDT